MHDDELELLSEASRRAADYLGKVDDMSVYPSASAQAALAAFDEPLPVASSDPAATLALLDEVGSPATSVSNGPRYFGFVIGATLPAAAAAERLAAAWDQCASSHVNSPAAAKIEVVAGRWLLEALDLPAGSAVGFGTSATACGLSCLAAARRSLLARQGWDFDGDGLIGAPEIRVVVSDVAHITVHKALRLLGFGERRLAVAPTDGDGRVDPERLPELDERTILCLQAGEVNTGELDPFVPLIDAARDAGAWVHVDGAFGLWARASAGRRHLTEGVERADSWTTDGHKWLNTPYDGAVAICRDATALSEAMNADAAYATAEPLAQKNLTLEFSRRLRGLPIWAALRSLGRSGVSELVERHCRQAKRLSEGLAAAGVVVLNRVVLNQVLGTLPDEEDVAAFLQRVQAGGRIWFGPSKWRGRAAFRLSVSSWRTTDDDVETAIEEVARHLRRASPPSAVSSSGRVDRVQSRPMPRITKVYTRTGDDGTTALGGGQRVSKESRRVAAYGTVDELSSAIGVALAAGVVERLAAPLTRIQNELFHLGSDLCILEEDKERFPVPRIEERHVAPLERLMDELSRELAPLENFILPGGTPAAAHLHVARAVCRRAEREVVALALEEPVGAHTVRYLNRLSDALFVMARYENKKRGAPDVLWDSRA